MEDASQLDDLGLLINRVDDPVFALRDPEAGEASVREVGELFRVGWTRCPAEAENFGEGGVIGDRTLLSGWAGERETF